MQTLEGTERKALTSQATGVSWGETCGLKNGSDRWSNSERGVSENTKYITIRVIGM